MRGSSYPKVTADEASRISDTSTRPLFHGPSMRAQDPSLPCTLRADLTIDTSGKSVAAIAREVRGVLEREGILWQRK
ncbi:MAG: hypothetical protein ACLTMP_04860 [Eggerthella lenta]